MPTLTLPDTVEDARVLILAELQQHPFLPVAHFHGLVHPRLLHEALHTLSADSRVNVTNGHLHLGTPDHQSQDATATTADLITKVLAREHHPRTHTWIELALPVELSPALTDALTLLMLDGKLSAVKTPKRPDRYRLV